MLPNDALAKRRACYGILFHMLGLLEESDKEFGVMARSIPKSKPSALLTNLSKLARKILDHAEIQAAMGKTGTRTGRRGPADAAARLRDIAELTCKIIAPAPGAKPHLGRECSASRRRGTAKDDPIHGYSRDPFKHTKQKHVDDIALAAVCYILRGYALFFCRPRSQRDYNAAKTALNDFHQAYQLTWRLYQNLRVNHHRDPGGGLTGYLENVISTLGRYVPPNTSAFYIWCLFLLCDIQRGNVYRQLGFVHEADRHYRHAEERFSLLRHSSSERDRDIAASPDLRSPNESGRGIAANPDLLYWFLTPTLIRALCERAKLRFDMGQFLEAIQTQLRCLEYIIRRHPLFGKARAYEGRPRDREERLQSATEDALVLSRQIDERIADIDRAVRFLDAERSLPMFDRRRITYYFGEAPPDRRTSEPWMGGTRPLTPESLAPCIPEDLAYLTAEILASVGFTLFTLRARMIARRKWNPTDIRTHNSARRRHQKWLRAYFRFDEVWRNAQTAAPRGKRRPLIQCAPLGFYGQTLLQTSGATLSPDMFPEQTERSFALRLREVAGGNPLVGRELKELGVYRALVGNVTQNIGNLVTIPRRNWNILMRRGYHYRRTEGDLSENSVLKGFRKVMGRGGRKRKARRQPPRREPAISGKLVVLRRWQSLNPIIPHPGGRRLRGGGYYLLWRDKGIVIDPGYDFIQNFYDEGFSLEDIDAVVITHSHPDHDADFANLTSLVKEWNDFYHKMGRTDLEKTLDIFLNVSAYTKFSAWLGAANVKIGRVIPLVVTRWNRDTASATAGPFRGDNINVDLSQATTSPVEADEQTYKTYGLRLEVIPAWHDDIIGRTAAVGLKFHLYDNGSCSKVGIIGFTGDTGAYGLDIARGRCLEDNCCVDYQFQDCDILVGHLGDIRLRELASVMRARRAPWRVGARGSHPLLDLLGSKIMQPRSQEYFKVQDFLQFLISLDLVHGKALQAQVACRNRQEPEVEIGKWLFRYIDSRGSEYYKPPYDSSITQKAMKWLREDLSRSGAARETDLFREMRNRLRSVTDRINNAFKAEKDRAAYSLLAFLAISGMTPWQYPYHLGIFGLYKLFERMVTHWASNEGKNRVFVVGELPEELTSYRHMIAQRLNMVRENALPGGSERRVHAFTGDIGLHIGLRVDREEGSLEPLIRCSYCDYNNEIVCARENYHSPGRVIETPLKRMDSAMIYLCTKKDHHPENSDMPSHFLSHPEVRVI